MEERDAAAFHLSDDSDAEGTRAYHALSRLAVAGLAPGIFSFTALVDSIFWVVPLLGTIASGAALWRIDPRATAGRRAALAGLLLSVTFGVAVPVDDYVSDRLLLGEARQFAALWFRFLAEGEPRKAYQLTIYPDSRLPLDDTLEDFFAHNPRQRQQMEDYLKLPLVRRLLTLGKKAEVRFDRAVHGMGDRAETLQLLYTVRYDTPEGAKTFSANLQPRVVSLGQGAGQLATGPHGG